MNQTRLSRMSSRAWRVRGFMGLIRLVHGPKESIRSSEWRDLRRIGSRPRWPGALRTTGLLDGFNGVRRRLLVAPESRVVDIFLGDGGAGDLDVRSPGFLGHGRFQADHVI